MYEILLYNNLMPNEMENNTGKLSFDSEYCIFVAK